MRGSWQSGKTRPSCWSKLGSFLPSWNGCGHGQMKGGRLLSVEIQEVGFTYSSYKCS